MSQFNGQVGTLEGAWEGERWAGIERAYGAEDVVRLRGSVHVEHTLAELGAKRLWELLSGDGYVRALGAISGGQAVQMVKAGLEAIYLSGWQVAADGNLAGEVYPDQSLYPANSVPATVRRLNNALTARRPDRVGRGQERHVLARPDRRRRGGRVRRAVERIRAHERDDRGGRRGRALRGPARVREEVRAPGRQGARSHEPVRADAERRPTCGRRHGRPDGAGGPDRCAFRHASHERRGRARPRVRDRRADSRGLLPRAAGARARDRSRTRVCALCGRSLVRDLDAGSRGGSYLRRGCPRRVPRQAHGLQLLAVLQLEAGPRRRGDRELPGRPRSSRLQVPVHHPGGLPRARTSRCSSWRAATPRRA